MVAKYTVQGRGSLLVEVGLSVCRLGLILHELGLNILCDA